MDMKINILGIIAIIGALLMIIGVFLNWISIDVWGHIESASGWEIATDGDSSEILDYWYAPIVALVCGIISFIAMIVPMALPAKNIGKVLGILGLILAIVTLVVSFLYYGEVGNETIFGISAGVGSGVWVVIVGAIITIIGGIIDIVKKPAKCGEQE